jgi:CheY-like chemotaxis protein
LGTDSEPAHDPGRVSARSPLAPHLHRLRSTLARLRGELDLAELDGRAPSEAAFSALGDALQILSAIEAIALGNPVRVVVVDDDERLAELTARRLRGRGLLAESTADLDASLEAARSGARLVVDYGVLANQEGAHVEAALSTSGAIVVSGSVSEADRRRALAMGAAAFMVKPVEIDALVELLRREPEAKRR